MTTLNVRVEKKTKREARKALADIGLDMSSAVNIFLKQVIVEQGLPFTPTKKDPKKIRAAWDREAAWALKHGKRYTDTKELFRDLGIE
ncbi:hypothetical protein A3C18_04080 [Candidatus Kaiserbacteria bacterium RIFCSPHIGHO2_02_FULL_54_11b]|uniref:Damage-inducible protein J n=1 Tax=Candidatus Kaiserbacteria bacterium RIFCSPHIGHO2_02_FULL_54_11b TaxID=1798494 RepID=A0A1F6DSM5_9BACT|nr:MAG: hypothetical protein A3C18_04080 [Candidatus Kaiserbacteria bacterium RIFCSPHIGHO2_02_FULL_54_11b]